MVHIHTPSYYFYHVCPLNPPWVGYTLSLVSRVRVSSSEETRGRRKEVHSGTENGELEVYILPVNVYSGLRLEIVRLRSGTPGEVFVSPSLPSF